MKVTLAQIVDAIKGVRILDNTANPGKESRRVNERTTEPLLKYFEQYIDQHNKLVTKYGEQKEDGRFQVPPDTENWKKYKQDADDLLNDEIEIDIDLFPSSLVDRANISPADVRTLKCFIAPEESKDDKK